MSEYVIARSEATKQSSSYAMKLYLWLVLATLLTANSAEEKAVPKAPSQPEVTKSKAEAKGEDTKEEASKEDTAKEGTKDPVVSPSGQMRMAEQIEKLRASIHEAETNIDGCDKNADTLQREITTLEGLAKEHAELLKQYDSYLSMANDERKKNAAGLAELDKWEKQFQKAPKETQEAMRSKLDASKLERADRNRWETDAQAKIASLEGMKKGIAQTLKEVDGKKASLKEQIQTWKEKKTKLKDEMAGLETKKGTLERLLVQVQEKYKERYPASQSK